MWTLQSAFPSSFWLRLALKRLFWADQNRHSPITAAESSPVLWRANFPAWHIRSLRRLCQIQNYTWLRMPRYSPLTSRLLREGTHAPLPSLPLPPPSPPHPFSLSLHRPCVVAITHTRVPQPRNAARCLGCCTSAETQIRCVLTCCAILWWCKCFFSFSKEHCLKRVL